MCSDDEYPVTPNWPTAQPRREARIVSDYFRWCAINCPAISQPLTPSDTERNGMLPCIGPAPVFRSCLVDFPPFCDWIHRARNGTWTASSACDAHLRPQSFKRNMLQHGRFATHLPLDTNAFKAPSCWQRVAAWGSALVHQP